MYLNTWFQAREVLSAEGLETLNMVACAADQIGVREIPGFVDYYFVDAGDGVMISTSIFEESSGEEESNWRAGQFVGQHLSLSAC